MEDNEKTFPDDTLVTMFRGGDNHAFEVLLARLRVISKGRSKRAR